MGNLIQNMSYDEREAYESGISIEEAIKRRAARVERAKIEESNRLTLIEKVTNSFPRNELKLIEIARLKPINKFTIEELNFIIDVDNNH